MKRGEADVRRCVEASGLRAVEGNVTRRTRPGTSSLQSCQTVIWFTLLQTPTDDITHLHLLLAHGRPSTICTFWLLAPANALWTHNDTWKNLITLVLTSFLSYVTSLSVPVSVWTPPLSLSILRTGTWRPRSWFTATMWSVTTPTRLCASARWTPTRTFCWPASTVTSTAGDPTSLLR